MPVKEATPFMIFLSVFQALLYRFTGEADLLVGTPVASRGRRETEDLIGLFVNTLVLRADLSGSPDFVALLERVRETTLSAYAHQEVPFERLVEDLSPERDLSRPPLVQVLFSLQNAPSEPLELPGLALTASGVNWISGETPSAPVRAVARIRYRHKEASATITSMEGARAQVVFDEPQSAIAPGQAVVFYDADVVLGGGWIE